MRNIQKIRGGYSPERRQGTGLTALSPRLPKGGLRRKGGDSHG